MEKQKKHVEEFRKFLEDRKAISQSTLARELEISYQHLFLITKGKRGLHKKTFERMLPILQKYGFGFKPKPKKEVSE